MAPEVLSSAVTPASDLWSAGVMAYQLLSGRLPFNDRRSPSSPSITVIWCVHLARYLINHRPPVRSCIGYLVKLSVIWCAILLGI